jgi:phospholipase/carboxylesterase
MTVEALGPLRARRVATSAVTQAKGSSPLTIVLLHGYGAPGDDLVGLASSIQAPAGSTFVFPEAPLSLGDLSPLPIYGDARAWWPIDVARLERAMARGELRDLSRDEPEGLAPARRALDQMLAALEAEGASRIVLGGFSQGAMLALDVALHRARPPAALILMSGTLIAEPTWAPRLAGLVGVPIVLSHGRGDPLLPFEISERLRDQLAAAGAVVDWHPFAGGHEIPREVLDAAGRQIRALAGAGA